MTAVEVLPPGAPEEKWLAARREGIGASEIAAVLGLSPWESPFSLYHRKANGWEMSDAEHLEAGRRAEGMIADWFADRADPNENLAVLPAGLYAHPERPWQLATPDRLVSLACDCPPVTHCQRCIWPDPVAVLECKHPYSWDGFGDDGTDDVPVYYRAQVLWQLDVLGVEKGYLAAYAQHQLRIYTIRRDEKDLEVMREAGRRFMRRLEVGDPPDIDEHTATIATLKRLHPSLEDGDVEADVQFAEAYQRARAAAARGEALVKRFEARIRQMLGNKRRLMCGTKLVASRSVYDTERVAVKRLREEQPSVAEAYVATSTTDRLNPGRSKSYA